MRIFYLLAWAICLWCAAADEDGGEHIFGAAAHSARATSVGLSEGNEQCAGCAALQGEVRTCLAGLQIIAARLNRIEERLDAARHQQSRLDEIERNVQETRAVAEQALRAAQIMVIHQMNVAKREQAGIEAPPGVTRSMDGGQLDGAASGGDAAKRSKAGDDAT